MKRITLFFMLVAALMAGEISPKPFKALPMFAAPEIKVTRAYDHGALYEVEFISQTSQGMKRFRGYLTRDKKAFIAGSAYDIKTQALLKMPLENIKAIKANADIKVGTGKEELIVITDPECHYCQVFQRRWEALSKKYTFYVYMYPLAHHMQAKQMSYYVLSQKSDAAKVDALLKLSQGEQSYRMFKATKAMQKQFDAKFESNQILANRLGVRGTPSVYDFTGGFVNWSALEE